MGMGHERGVQAGQIIAIGASVFEDGFGCQASAQVDQGQLIATVDDVDMAVERVAQAEAEAATADQADFVGQTHR